MAVNLGISVLAMMTALSAQQQDAQSILATVGERQIARWGTVENYAVEQRMEGATTAVPLYFVKDTVDGQITFRQVPTGEWMADASGAQRLTPEAAEAYAAGWEMIADAHVAQGHPLGPAIKDMSGDAALFLRAAASGPPEDEADAGQGDAAAMAEFGRRARLVGTESVGGREAYVLQADDLSDVALEQGEGDGELTLETMRMWIDGSEYVPLRLEMKGEYAADGERTPVTFELAYENYRQVGSLYEAERQVMRISGLMEAMATDPKQKEELEEMRREFAKAQEEMDKMEEQLDDMPAAARGMVEGQMQKARQQMQMMAEDGVIEGVKEMRIISINEGPPINWSPSGS